MIWKRTLLLSISLLFALIFLNVFTLNTLRVSALEYPAIYISPAAVRTADPVSAIGTNYTFLIYTDYSGSDVWGYELNLFFDPAVLECVELVNGDLITEDTGITMWSAGDINNTSGEVETTGNGFWATPPAEPPVTSGPGSLANVTFMVVGYGISNITLGADTRLIGYASGEKYNIVDSSMMGHMQDSILYNLLPGDIDGDAYVGSADAGVLNGAYGTYEGDPLYDQAADFDLDGYIGSADAGVLNGNYGMSV